MIQDIAPHKFINHYDPSATISDEDPILIVRSNKLLCRILEAGESSQDPEAFRPEEQIHDGTGMENAGSRPRVMEFPRWKEVRTWLEQAAETRAAGSSTNAVPGDDPVTYLFTIDREEYFLLNENDTDRCADGIIPQQYHFYSLSELRESDIGPKVREFAAMTGMHLAHWYGNNRFCGRCGTPTVKDDKERALRCPHCGNVIYPRIVPAVIVGVLNPRTNQILLTKYRVGYSHYALVAGFTEIGETLEGTVRREVMEETGLRVKNIRYYKSQPWGIVDDILAGFYCEVDGDDHIRMDTGELKVAEWVSPEDIELQPQDFSLTNEMMLKFKRGEVAL